MIMNMNKKYVPCLFALLLITLFSCNDFLDEMPDNRAELDSEEKIRKMLVNAYPVNQFVLVTELASDNVDDYGVNNPYTTRFWEQLYNWVDVTENDNESPKRIWEGCYSAIANANQALQAIEEMGNPASLNPARGEALVARAYSHFILTNVFGQHYSKTHSETDLGVTYMEKAETELNPKYERETVADNYEKIAKDLEEGLPLINDAFYSVPRYHFNSLAAYTFASRFYLFYQNWDKAIQYATMAIGENPNELLRDYASLVALPRDLGNVAIQYTSSSRKSNLLVQTGYSQLGTIFGAYYTGSRYSHGNLIAQTESFNQAPWGRYPTNVYNYNTMYKLRPYIYAGTNLDKTLVPRVPYIFEMLDPVAQTGYRRAVYVALKSEEALLNRAEAYIMKGDLGNALADINIWTANTLNPATSSPNLTDESIKNWAVAYEYYTPEQPTPKKKLNPDFINLTEGSLQESYLHCLLFMRRHEFLHEGMRWFDVKRYGIEIHRRTVDGLTVKSVDDTLSIRDNRRAIQVPQDVVDAGLTPNPR